MTPKTRKTREQADGSRVSDFFSAWDDLPGGTMRALEALLAEVRADERERMGQALPSPSQMARWIDEYTDDAASFGAEDAKILTEAAFIFGAQPTEQEKEKT